LSFFSDILKKWLPANFGKSSLLIEYEASIVRDYVECVLEFRNRGETSVSISSVRAVKPKGSKLCDTLPLLIDSRIERFGPIASEIPLSLKIPPGSSASARLHLLPPMGWRRGKVHIDLKTTVMSHRARHSWRTIRRVV
jgi:hypothetical protein